MTSDTEEEIEAMRSKISSERPTEVGDAEITLTRVGHDDTMVMINLNDFGVEALFNALSVAKNSRCLSGEDIGQLSDTIAQYMIQHGIQGAGTASPQTAEE